MVPLAVACEEYQPAPELHFSSQEMRRRVISDDKENASGSKDNSGKLKTVKRKVKHLFGKADKEEENQAADFEEDDTQVSCRKKSFYAPIMLK